MTSLLSRTAAPRRRLADNVLTRALTFPHGVDGYRDAYRPGAAAAGIAATVVEVTPRTDRAVSLLLRPEQPMTFAAGQHVLVTTEIAGVRRTRCYSLSDTPRRADGLLEITVAHLPDGLVSSHLVHDLPVGTTLGLSAPQGHDFIMPASRPDRVLLIGGGSGVTPLRSMWRTLAAEGRAHTVTVVLYARTAADAIFADEIAALPGGHVVLTRAPEGSSRPSTPPATARLHGRFSPTHLDTLALDLHATATYVCGPPGLVDAVRDALSPHDLLHPLRSESFAPATAPTDPAAAGGVLTFAGSGRSAHNDGRTLLEEAEAAGLTPASGCRMGICHSCTTVKHAGVVRDVRTGETDDGSPCEVQLCISQAVGDVQLDL